MGYDTQANEGKVGISISCRVGGGVIKKILRTGCFLMVCVLGFLLVSCSSKISIVDYMGDVRIQYTHKRNFERADELLPYWTEDEIFGNADLIFSGTVRKIRNIEINYAGRKIYKSLIEIQVDQLYCGSDFKTYYTVMAAPIGRYPYVEDEELLCELKKGIYGIFIADAVPNGTYLTENGCTFDASEVCDAQFSDGVRFGFIRQKRGEAVCCDTLCHKLNQESKVFTSLSCYDWDSIVQYVRLMTGHN